MYCRSMRPVSRFVHRSGNVVGMGLLRSKGMVILAGNSHPELVKAVCHHLDVRPGNCSVFFRSSRETDVEIKETVRGNVHFLFSLVLRPRCLYYTIRN